MLKSIWMGFAVRRLSFNDIPQVVGIEREAFPTEHPSISYYELQNRSAHYLVAYEEGKEVPLFPSLIDRVRGWFQINKPPPTTPYIVGVIGFWLYLREAHIILIAVRKEYRRRGIGELMLIAAIKEAIQLGADLMGLEVRVSNLSAQALYQKYGFRKVGLRPRYYFDNGEDGYIMTTEPLSSSSFQSLFEERQKLYQEKWRRSIKIDLN